MVILWRERLVNCMHDLTTATLASVYSRPSDPIAWVIEFIELTTINFKQVS
jgi:hypothetical protein